MVLPAAGIHRLAAFLHAELTQLRTGLPSSSNAQEGSIPALPCPLCVQAWWPPLWPGCPTTGALRRSESGTSGPLAASPKVRRGCLTCWHGTGAEL